MHRRINVTLPEDTVRLLDRAAPKGNRSRLIDLAVREFVRSRRTKTLRQRVKAGAVRRAEQDLRQAQDWFALEEEAWQTAPR